MSVTLVDVSPQPTVHQRRSVPTDQIGPAMGEMLPASFHAAVQAGATLTGPPYARYHSHSDPMDLEAGVPTQDTVEVGDGFATTALPGGRAATLLHTGPYDQLPAAWARLHAWMAEHGHTPLAAWESYLTDPGEQPDPATWQTRLFVLIEAAE